MGRPKLRAQQKHCNGPEDIWKWNPSSKLSKEELTFVPVWIKFHGVLGSTFTTDGLSAIAIHLGTPVIDLCTVTTCVQSWGRVDYARALVDIRADRALKDTMEDNGTPMDDLVDGTKKRVGAPSRKTGIWSGGDDDPNVEDGSDKTTHSSKLLGPLLEFLEVRGPLLSSGERWCWTYNCAYLLMDPAV
ncbi:ARID DNA-binding domain-containing protein [Tanacetum coccineum]